MKFIFRMIGWIIRLIVIVALLLGGYLVYQKFVNDIEPKVVIDSLVYQSTHSIQTVSTTIKETTKDITGTTGKQVCYQKDCYEVEIADTPARRQQGLMFREELADDAGMLFVFDTPSNYNFWMKNTKLTLDMIWLSESFEIIHINSNTPPCSADPCPTYGPEQADALYVLELKGGEAIDREIGKQLTTKNL